ncbi:MAG: trehalase family glycosidase [Rikenellaceae bacterium]
MKNIFSAIFALGLAISLFDASAQEGEKVKNRVSDEFTALYTDLKAMNSELSTRVVQPAEGYLKYPYLIPAGFYKQMWDWDGFFMGSYFCAHGKPEYMKYWFLNLVEGIDEKGYVAGCATTEGPRPIFGDFSMKPFLAQGALIYSQKVDDFSWLKPYYEGLKKTVTYRETTQQDEKTGLFFWQIAMQSGADNNVALNYFTDDSRSYLACDASALQNREYKAMAIIASKLGNDSDAALYKSKSEKLESAINQILWCEVDKTYYNVDRETGEFYKRITYSNFWVLADGIAPRKNGEQMIKRYLTSEKHLKGDYGYLTLSKQDVDYNNKNVIVPFSNWQGPVWPVANYIYSIALDCYDFDKEREWVAATLADLMLKDFAKYGSLHENYNAETGAGLAPADSYKDSEGKFIGFVSWNLCIETIFDEIAFGKENALIINNL